MKNPVSKQGQNRSRFRTLTPEAAKQRLLERLGTDIDPDLLAGVIFTLDEKPYPQKITRKITERRTKLETLYKLAELEGPPKTGSLTGARLEYFKEISRHNSEDPAGSRAMFRVHHEEMAYQQGLGAGAFAYGFSYDPLKADIRTHMCLIGNFCAKWNIRPSLRRWLDGYQKGWINVCQTDGGKKIAHGINPDEPQPLPEFNPFLRKALESRLKNALASSAKYSRKDFVRKNELRKEIRRQYEYGKILDHYRKAIYKKSIAASTFFDAMSPDDQAIWEKSGESNDVRADNTAERGAKDLSKALYGAKRPIKPKARSGSGPQ